MSISLIVFDCVSFCSSVGKLCPACLNKMPVVGLWAHHGDSTNAKNAPRNHVSYCLTLTNKNSRYALTLTIICLVFTNKSTHLTLTCKKRSHSYTDKHLPHFQKQKHFSHPQRGKHLSCFHKQKHTWLLT